MLTIYIVEVMMSGVWQPLYPAHELREDAMLALEVNRPNYDQPMRIRKSRVEIEG